MNQILYICTGNSYRSVLAEALTKEQKEDLNATSAGINLTEEISEVALEQISRNNTTDLLKDSPERVTQEKLDKADKVVCMMPEHMEFLQKNFEIEDEKVEVWDIEDPHEAGPKAERAFEEIKQKVEDL